MKTNKCDICFFSRIQQQKYKQKLIVWSYLLEQWDEKKHQIIKQ